MRVVNMETVMRIETGFSIIFCEQSEYSRGLRLACFHNMRLYMCASRGTI
jgi:hypothetical protein